MRYFIFTILLVAPLLLTAQSKKEQIATLVLRVDSLSEVLVNDRITNAQTLSDKSDKIFQLSQENVALGNERDSIMYMLNVLNDSIVQKNILLSKSSQEIDSLERKKTLDVIRSPPDWFKRIYIMPVKLISSREFSDYEYSNTVDGYYLKFELNNSYIEVCYPFENRQYGSIDLDVNSLLEGEYYSLMWSPRFCGFDVESNCYELELINLVESTREEFLNYNYAYIDAQYRR